jgi:hypothetical protein
MKTKAIIILITLAAIVLGQPAKSQYVPEPWSKDELKEASASEFLDFAKEDNDDIIWYEDFADGLPEDWLNENLNGFCAFTHSFKGPQGPLSLGMPPLNSSSAHNGFMILDSDLCSSVNTSGLLTNAMLTSPPISISGNTNLMLSFQHNFRYCCSPTQTQIRLEVSTDGELWTSYDVRNGLGPNNTSPNPLYEAIDITEISTGATQVWIRFRNTGVSHYWWMIDDVMLKSFVENDLELTDYTTAGGYASIPSGQQQPFLFEATVRNAGGKDQTNVELLTTVNDYLYRSVLTRSVINPTQVVDFVTSESFLANGRGTYEVVFAVEQDQDDINPDNNRASYIFEITDTIYSRTGKASSADAVVTGIPGTAFAAGNRFEIFKEIEVTSLSFVADINSQAGARVKAVVYSLVDGDFSQLVSSNDYILGQDEISTEDSLVFVTIPFNEPLLLEAGDYLAVIDVHAQPEIVKLAALTPNNQPDDASYFWIDGNWITHDVIPMIDMNFGDNKAECDPMFYFDITNGLCGTPTGKVEVIPLNGIAPYTYQWTDFPDNNSAVLDGVMAGEYEVLITDAYGCESTKLVAIADDEIEVDFTTTPAICNVGGTAKVIPLNGTAPFTYAWSHNASLQSDIATGLASGSYTVTVTDVNSCATQITITVGNQTTLPVTITKRDAFCNSGTGSIELEPTGGLPPYTYQWSEFPAINQARIDDLAPGTYFFSVKDSNNCQFTASSTVGQDVYQLSIVVDKVNATCNLNNGSIAIDVVNGQAPYAYHWGHGDSEPVLENLIPGVYQLEVSDDYGCIGVQTIEITNTGQMPQVTYSAEDAQACGQSTGSFVIEPVDPEMNYIYQIDFDKAVSNPLFGAKTNAFSVGNLAAGRYLVTVVNDDGCELLVGINISDADAGEVTADIKSVKCFGNSDGSISLSLPGGTDPVYLWDDADASSTPLLTGLKAGVYSVTVADGDCTTAESFTVTEPEPLRATATIDHIICANDEKGNISLNIQGGTFPYAYIWSNGFSGMNLADVAAGNYTISIVDFNECTFTQAYTITGNPPLVLGSTVQQPTDDASDGRIILNITGGKGEYSFAWDHGPQSSVLTDLAPGTYTVRVTDGEGCQVVETFVLSSTNLESIENDKNTVKVFPNPVRETLHVNLQGWNSGPAHSFSLEVFNLLGERVYINESIDGNPNITVATGDLHKGVYILRVSNGSEIRQARFMKN